MNLLLKVFILLDLFVNYFSDKCYDSVSFCLCLIFLEGVLLKGIVSKGKDFNRCVCGFGAFEGIKFIVGIGLFFDDVCVILFESMKLFRKEGVFYFVFEVKKEGLISFCVKRRVLIVIVLL